MFFINWGSKTVVINLGLTGSYFCGICEHDRDFYRLLHYRVHHVWWIFRRATRKTYRDACDICGRGNEVDAREVEERLGKSPMPFLDRFGWAFGVILLAAFVTFATLDTPPRSRPTQSVSRG
ncbi:hypothetical protein GCM10022253_26300 [Sphingomonas endophytica]|uniref:Zinc-ribbon 15 domain-containing protein n=1 Tax=Sphingomonas endophytica TaxID=869719 RepID=A0ABR6N8B4_9SPHN|nr:hypothetical protein [Sphingomonas endophytica]MBB5727039.1 hypothetical protein [Sphingomonas endophytica]